MKILCWNVNGLRAIGKKGFFDWFQREDADIVCLQETKASPHQLDEQSLKPFGYTGYFASAERAGYSGVAIYSRVPHVSCTVGIDNPRFDCEGRTLVYEHESFILINSYYPNGGEENARVPYKLAYSDAVLALAKEKEKSGKPVILCGDFNTAHREIDIARPKENEMRTGFLPIERAWLDKLTASGYVDIFRARYPTLRDQYTWWSYRMQARERNVGWRIDYFFVSASFVPRVTSAEIHPHVEGSDHCPISLEFT